jgi:hypothetical protein
VALYWFVCFVCCFPDDTTKIQNERSTYEISMFGKECSIIVLSHCFLMLALEASIIVLSHRSLMLAFEASVIVLSHCSLMLASEASVSCALSSFPDASFQS